MTRTLNITREVAALRRMTVPQLRSRYAALYGAPTRCGNKDWLWKRIIWRLQADAEGGLAEWTARVRALADEIGGDVSFIRRRHPRDTTAPPSPDSITRTEPVKFGGQAPGLMPGMVLTRQYKGQTISVAVRQDGFEYDGQVYRSLSAVATAVTGSHWSGNLFFGIHSGTRTRPGGHDA